MSFKSLIAKLLQVARNQATKLDDAAVKQGIKFADKTVDDFEGKLETKLGFKLPIDFSIEELFGDDFVVVQAKNRTALIPFDDFVIGEQQVSFYKEIVDARNTITALTSRVDQIESNVNTNTESITDNTSTVEEVEQNATNITSALGQTAIEISLLTNKLNSVESDIEAQNTEIANVQSGVNSLTESSSAATISQLEQTVAAQETTILQLQSEIETLKSTINGLTPQIFTVNGRLDALEG